MGDNLADKWLGSRNCGAILASEAINAKRGVRHTMKKRDQVALPSHAGFGEDAFDLRSHGTIGHADRVSQCFPSANILGLE